MSWSGSRWPQADDEFLIARYSRQSLAGIAREMGRKMHAVASHAQILVRGGLLDPETRYTHRPWTAAELDWADTKLRDGWRLEEVAAFLPRGTSAILRALWKAGRGPGHASRRFPGTLNLKDVAALMGVVRYVPVQRWVRPGLLPAHRHRDSKRGIFRVYPAEFIEFLQQHPESYQYDNIPHILNGKPNPYRPHARRVVPEALQGRITAQQAASLLGLPVGEVWSRCRKGMLPAIHVRGVPGVSAREWWIDKQAVLSLAGQNRRAA